MTNRFLATISCIAGAALLAFAALGAPNTGSTLLGVTGDNSQLYHGEYVGKTSATPLNGGTNNIARATTNTYNLTVNTRDYSAFSLEVGWVLNAAGTGSNVITIQKSYDNSKWYSAGSFVGTNNGTNAVFYDTNITTGNYGYWRITTIGNTNASADITNLTAVAWFKPYIYGNFKH